MTDADRKDASAPFLNRWSRMKAQAREEAPAVAAVPPVEPTQQERAPELPPIDQLTIDSDFRDFFHPKVDEDVRRAALRKLFAEPHFNVMDGLDVYIDDYSKSEPIPAAMLASMKQAQRILQWAKGEDDETAQHEPSEPTPDAPDPENLAAISPADDVTQTQLSPADPLVEPQPSRGEDDERTL
jgi:hypothetical protein